MARTRNKTRKCPHGMLRRKAFTRRAGRTLVKVPAVCIVDQGLPGSFRERHPNSEGIGHLRTGKLTRFNYHINKSTSKRHAALRKAVIEYGTLSVFRMLMAVATYSRHTNPSAWSRYRSDAAWIKEQYAPYFGK